MYISKIGTNIVSKTQALRESAVQRMAIVDRAADVYHFSNGKKAVKKATNAITGFITPVLKKIKTESPTINSISETFSTISRNISKAKMSGETNSSCIKNTVEGIKASKKDIVHSLGELSGVNDVKLAKEQAGTGRAILEGGKSMLRFLTAGGLSAVCLPIPIPGAMIGGWFAGEKLAEKLVGQPFSKLANKVK